MIEGVRKIDSGEWSVYFIDQLSDALKKEIRHHLSTICFGSINANSGRIAYSYKATAREFVKRYIAQDGDGNRQKGMVGELLFHVLMSIENEYIATSAFFNLEERSFKKGFDLSFFSVENQELWIAEVKSGEKKKSQSNQTQAIVSLINTAKSDLKKRLNSDNNTLWLNAINHARLAVNETIDEKKIILNLLGDYSDQAEAGIYTSEDKNVMLVGVLFHPICEEADPRKIQGNHEKTKKASIFSKVRTVAIQKETYEAVFRFLESEAADE